MDRIKWFTSVATGALLTLGMGGLSARAQGGADAAGWSAALQRNSAPAFREFLQDHPTSTYAPAAFRRLVEIEVGQPVGDYAPPAIRRSIPASLLPEIAAPQTDGGFSLRPTREIY